METGLSKDKGGAHGADEAVEERKKKDKVEWHGEKGKMEWKRRSGREREREGSGKSREGGRELCSQSTTTFSL